MQKVKRKRLCTTFWNGQSLTLQNCGKASSSLLAKYPESIILLLRKRLNSKKQLMTFDTFAGVKILKIRKLKNLLSLDLRGTEKKLKVLKLMLNSQLIFMLLEKIGPSSEWSCDCKFNTIHQILWVITHFMSFLLGFL